MVRQFINASIVLILLGVLLMGCSPPNDQNGIGDGGEDSVTQSSVPGAERVTIDSSDGVEIVGTLMRAPGGERGVICLHMYPADRHSWGEILPKLAEAGITALAIDLRGTGESAPELADRYTRRDPGLFSSMPQDVEAAKQYLTQQVGLAPERIGLMGASIGCTVAILAAAEDPEYRALVLLSPGLNYFEVSTRQPMRALDEAWVFMVYAEDATGEADAASTLAELHANPERHTVRAVPGTFETTHGTRAFARDPDLTASIIEFLDAHIP